MSRRGWWAVEIQPTSIDELVKQTGEIIMPALRGTPRKVSSTRGPVTAWITRATDAGDMFQYAEEGRLWLISPTSPGEKMLSAIFPGLANASIDVTRDGKEIVFVTPRLSSRLILLENVFR